MSGAKSETLLNSGVVTLHARAEAWECDFNGHWNTRYFCKAFQAAAEVAAMLGGSIEPEGERAEQRVLRFHAEMHSGDPLTIRTFNLSGAENGPALAYYMFRYGEIVATAVDYGLVRSKALTELDVADAKKALPRGLTDPAVAAWTPDPVRDRLFELGPVQAQEKHEDGHMQFWSSVARMSNASHHHDLDLGFTLERMKEEGIGRMLAELRYTRLGRCEPGDFLRVASRLTSAQGKAFTTAHMLYTHRGTPIAMFELCTLSVDMTARRAITLPDFVLARFAETTG